MNLFDGWVYWCLIWKNKERGEKPDMREKVESLADAKLWIETRLKGLQEQYGNIISGEAVPERNMDYYWHGDSVALTILLGVIEEGESGWRSRSEKQIIRLIQA